MRFPIKTKFVKSKYPRIVADGIVFVNLSDALQESLQDIGIIDPKTHELRQEYFDLSIEEGPVLGCMNEFFDLTGNLPALFIASIGMTIMFADWLIQSYFKIISNNYSRFITGIVGGAGVGIFIWTFIAFGLNYLLTLI